MSHSGEEGVITCGDTQQCRPISSQRAHVAMGTIARMAVAPSSCVFHVFSSNPHASNQLNNDEEPDEGTSLLHDQHRSQQPGQTIGFFWGGAVLVNISRGT